MPNNAADYIVEHPEYIEEVIDRAHSLVQHLAVYGHSESVVDDAYETLNNCWRRMNNFLEPEEEDDEEEAMPDNLQIGRNPRLYPTAYCPECDAPGAPIGDFGGMTYETPEHE